MFELSELISPRGGGLKKSKRREWKSAQSVITRSKNVLNSITELELTPPRRRLYTRSALRSVKRRSRRPKVKNSDIVGVNKREEPLEQVIMSVEIEGKSSSLSRISRRIKEKNIEVEGNVREEEELEELTNSQIDLTPSPKPLLDNSQILAEHVGEEHPPIINIEQHKSPGRLLSHNLNPPNYNLVSSGNSILFLTKIGFAPLFILNTPGQILKFERISPELVSASDNKGGIHIVNIESKDIQYSLYGHKESVWGMAYKQSNNTLITGSNDHTIKVWNISKRICIHTLQGHADSVFCIYIHTHTGDIVSGGKDRTVRVWETNKYKCLRLMQTYQGTVWKIIHLTPQTGELMLTVCSGSLSIALKIWNYYTAQTLKNISSDTFFASARLLSCRLVLVGGEEGVVKVLDWEKEEFVGEVALSAGCWVRSLHLLDPQTVSVSMEGGKMAILHLDTMLEDTTIIDHNTIWGFDIIKL